MTLVSMALLNLVHRPWRSGLSVGGVVLAIAAYVALVGLVVGIEGTLVDGFTTRGADLVLSEAGADDILSSVVPDGLSAEILGVPGVVEAAPELGRLTSMNDGPTVYVLGWEPGAFGWASVDFTTGRAPLPEDAEDGIAGGIGLGRALAERYGLSIGDTVTIFAASYRITGFFEAKSVMMRNGAIALLPDVQAQTYREGQATALVVQLDPALNEDGRDAVIADLRARFPSLSVDPTETLIDEFMNLRIARVLAWSVSTVAIVSAALAVLNTMAMAVNERRGEIAIMGAVGWPRWRIILCLLIEGSVLTLIGSVLGVGVGIAAAWAITSAPAVAGFVVPVIEAPTLLRAVALGIGIGLVGTLGPAWRAAGRDPAAILRGH
jgi:putative ABC transport system permease protein